MSNHYNSDRKEHMYKEEKNMQQIAKTLLYTLSVDPTKNRLYSLKS